VGRWSASRSGIFTVRYSSRIYGGSRTSLDGMTHIEIPASAETRISSVQPIQNYHSSNGYINDRCQYAVLDKDLLWRMEIHIFFMTRSGGLLNYEVLLWAEKYEVWKQDLQEVAFVVRYMHEVSNADEWRCWRRSQHPDNMANITVNWAYEMRLIMNHNVQQI